MGTEADALASTEPESSRCVSRGDMVSALLVVVGLANGEDNGACVFVFVFVSSRSLSLSRSGRGLCDRTSPMRRLDRPTDGRALTTAVSLTKSPTNCATRAIDGGASR